MYQLLKHNKIIVIILVIILNFAFVCNSADCIVNCSCTSTQDRLIAADCSHESMAIVPDYLPDGLWSLDLSHNKISLPWTWSLLECKNLTKLDVSYNNITVLKSVVPNLEDFTSSKRSGYSLEKIYLSNNRIRRSTIEKDSFKVFQKLLVLDLSGNKITNYGLNENSLSGLTQLRVLNLTNNNVELCEHSYPDMIFKDLISLKTLAINLNTYHAIVYRDFYNSTLRNCSPSYPDQALSYLTSLEELFIDLLQYPVILGVGFRNLSRLQLIYLQSASISEGVNAVSRNLFLNVNTPEPLSITFDSRTSIYFEPGVFDNLSTLQSLRFIGVFSSMENVSDTFTHLQSLQLKSLEISYIRCIDYCTLTSDWVRYIKNDTLETLIMEHNNFIDIDSRFFVRLPKTVKKISLAFNKFLSSKKLLGFYLMLNLQNLDLSSQFKYSDEDKFMKKMNYSFTYDDSIVRTKSRKERVLSIFSEQEQNCKTYSKLRGLHVLEVDKYKHKFLKQLERGKSGVIFNELPLTPNNSISLPRNLRILNFSYVTQELPINAIHIMDNVLAYADFSRNDAWCLEGPVTGLHKLEVFVLSNNNCFVLSQFMFSDFPSLRRLLLDNNAIGLSLEHDIEGLTFSKLYNLEYLDISQNYIRVISYNAFLGSPKLQSLIMNRNAIQDFNVYIRHLVNLTFIDLSSNDLARLSLETTTSLDDIYKTNFNLTVDLYRNNLVCDCDSVDFIDWFLSTKIYFRNKELYTCQYVNGSVINMNMLNNMTEITWRFCLGRQLFLPIIITFLLLVIVMVTSGLYSYFRVKLLFYIYVSKSRFFLHFSQPENQQVRDVFIVYDEESPEWRTFVSRSVKPLLESRGVSTYISEIDSLPGRPIRMVIEDSVLAARKTLVLLTSELFESDYHELEVNMAKLSEEMMPSKAVLFVRIESMNNAYIPKHILRYLETSTFLFEYYEGDTNFWDDLVQIINS